MGHPENQDNNIEWIVSLIDILDDQSLFEDEDGDGDRDTKLLSPH